RRTPAALIAPLADVVAIFVVVARAFNPLAAQAALIADRLLVIDRPMGVRQGSGNPEAQESTANEGCRTTTTARFRGLSHACSHGERKHQPHERMSQLPQHGDHRLPVDHTKALECRRSRAANAFRTSRQRLITACQMNMW